MKPAMPADRSRFGISWFILGAAFLVGLGLVALSSEAFGQDRPTTVVDACDDFYSTHGTTNLSAAILEAVRTNVPVTFACGSGVTIGTAPGRPGLRIRGSVVIDGGGAVTLDASNIVETEPLFVAVPAAEVEGTISLTLKNISIKNGLAKRSDPDGSFVSHFADANDLPPSVIFADMDLKLENVHVDNSFRPVLVVHHSVALVNTEFTRSRVSVAVETDGRLDVVNSRFISSEDAALSGWGETRVSGSTFIGNFSAIRSSGPLTVEHSLFQSNQESIQSTGSPSISVDRSVFDHNERALWAFINKGNDFAQWTRRIALSHNTFKANGEFKAGVPGGISAILLVGGSPPPGFAGPPFQLDLKYNNFIRNLGTAVRSLLVAELHPSLSVIGGSFAYNAGELGGGIKWENGSVKIANTLFKGNRADTGSAIYARGLEVDGSSIANSLIVEETSKSNGSAIDLESASLINVTIARNSSAGIAFSRTGADTRIVNTLFSQNSGGNCLGVPQTAIGPGNLQFGAEDCPEVQLADPQLDSFYAPDVGSVAAHAGDPKACREPPIGGYDIIHQSRREGSTCSSGAFEKQPVKPALKTIERADKAKHTQVCPNGMIIAKDAPCPTTFHRCDDGSTVPEGGLCPEPAPRRCSTGVVVSGRETCPNVPCIHGGERPENGTCPQYQCPDGQLVDDASPCPARQCRLGVTVPNGQRCPDLPCADGSLHLGDRECPPKQCQSSQVSVPDGQQCPPHFCRDENAFEPDGVSCYVAPH
jgi:hypothetical protein